MSLSHFLYSIMFKNYQEKITSFCKIGASFVINVEYNIAKVLCNQLRMVFLSLDSKFFFFFCIQCFALEYFSNFTLPTFLFYLQSFYFIKKIFFSICFVRYFRYFGSRVWYTTFINRALNSFQNHHQKSFFSHSHFS